MTSRHRVSFAVSAIAWMVLTLTGVAQSRPDFSGRWEIDVENSERLRDNERQGLTLVITQTGDRLTIERTASGGPPRTVTYTFDGRETVSLAGDLEVRARSRWEGNRLLTEGTQASTVVVAFTEVRNLSADGRTMIVESTYLLDGERVRRKLVFTRAPRE